jgi:hypothetical protein
MTNMIHGQTLSGTTDLGFSVKKAVKKGASGVKKGVQKGVKVAVSIHTLPLKLMLKAAVSISKVVCMAPKPALEAAAVAASVNVNLVPTFCHAVKIRNMGQIRGLLPPMIKMTAKLAATGAFPAAGPALQALKYIPGLSKFAGTDDGLEVIDNLGEGDLDFALGSFLDDDEIADSLGAPGSTNALLLLGLMAAVGGVGLYYGLKA